jgi:hypothetical protein
LWRIRREERSQGIVGSLIRVYQNIEGSWSASIVGRKDTWRNIVCLGKENNEMDNKRIIRKQM